MNLLVWSPFFPPEVGGIESLCARLNREFMSSGISVEVLTGTGPLTDTGTTVVDGVPIHRVDLRGAIDSRDVLRFGKARAEVRRIKMGFEPDLVHLHVSGPEPVFHLMTQTDPPTPTLVTTHGHESALFGTGSGAFPRSLFEEAACISVVSEQGRRALTDAMPQFDGEIVLIENGIDVPVDAAPMPTGSPVAAMVGRLVPQKLPWVAIEAMAILSETHPDLTLVVAGHGVSGERLMNLAKERGVSGRVDFTGPLDHVEVESLMRRSMMLVIPSAWEGMPLTALEAAAVGRPLVGTGVDGLSRLIRDGSTGYQVPVNDAGALARAMATIVDDPDRAGTLGRAAHAMARDEFSMPRCAEAYIAVYDRIMGADHG